MADDMFQGGELTPEQLAALAKAETFDVTYPACLALRCMGLADLEDHLHKVHIFQMANGQIAFGFGWCSASHVDTENFAPAELAAIKVVVRNMLEMKGHTVIERDGMLFIEKDGVISAIGMPGSGVSQERIDAEVEKFRAELDTTLGPAATKPTDPDDPMSRWMP
jgi:hypothetical protein